MRSERTPGAVTSPAIMIIRKNIRSIKTVTIAKSAMTRSITANMIVIRGATLTTLGSRELSVFFCIYGLLFSILPPWPGIYTSVNTVCFYSTDQYLVILALILWQHTITKLHDGNFCIKGKFCSV